MRGENNNNRLWKGDKLRNKECIHEERRMSYSEETEQKNEGDAE